MLSNIAHVEPLPFVPATWMKRSLPCGFPVRSASARVVSKPNLAPNQLRPYRNLMASAYVTAFAASQRLVMDELVRRGNEAFEQWMRLMRLAQELRVELA